MYHIAAYLFFQINEYINRYFKCLLIALIILVLDVDVSFERIRGPGWEYGVFEILVASRVGIHRGRTEVALQAVRCVKWAFS